MHISMKERSEWSLNGCLWLSQDNTAPKHNRKLVKYIGNHENHEEKIPREFIRHWRQQSSSTHMLKHPSPEKVKQPVSDEPKEDLEIYYQTKHCESMPDLSNELETYELFNRNRKSL